jgi:hypothetical protein
MLFAWLAISNHCALGSLVKNVRSAQTHAHCCGSGAPQEGGKVPGSDTRECCKTLHSLPAPTPDKLAKLAPEPLMASLVWDLVVEVWPAQAARDGELFDTGPPSAWSFAELVLHRSLRSHAPPFPA